MLAGGTIAPGPLSPHILLCCEKLIQFWKLLQSEMITITDFQLPRFCLRHDFSRCFGFYGHKSVIANALVRAKLFVAAYWKSPQCFFEI